jgi:hypothetical protein
VFEDAVAEVVAESFKDTGVRAFCVVAIDTVHTAMLGRFNPEALGLAATGSYDKWVVVMGPVKDRCHEIVISHYAEVVWERNGHCPMPNFNLEHRNVSCSWKLSHRSINS